MSLNSGAASDTQYQLDHANEDKSGLVRGFEIAFIVAGTAAVGLRLLSRKLLKLRYGLDDLMSILALLRSIF
jgi:hypothetical protein